MGEWQPIETAPRDGTPILVTGMNGSDLVMIGWFWDAIDPHEDCTDFRPGWKGTHPWATHIRIAEPTHWMPLPPAPDRKEQQP